MTVLERKSIRNPYGMTSQERAELAAEQAAQAERSAKIVARSWRENAHKWLLEKGCKVAREDRTLYITGPGGRTVKATSNAQVYNFLKTAGWPGAKEISLEGY